MARFHIEMLAASKRLIGRKQGQRGRLASARIRRSISTTYYALFHFLSDECARRLVGTANSLRSRRQAFVRVITHRGLKSALLHVRGRHIDAVQDFMGKAAAPDFARDVATVFLQMQNQRVRADYDLSASLTELDAQGLIRSVRRAIKAWERANTPADRDFKRALCLLIVLKGKLRSDEG